MRATLTLVVDRQGPGRIVGLTRPAVLLKVVRGVDRRRQHRCEGLRFTVGAVGSDLQLNDPTVSALHCEFRWEERGLFVRDLGSKNGVLLGGRQVTEAVVEPDDIIQLGNTSLKVQFLEEEVTTALSPRASFGSMVGSSVIMRSLYDSLARLCKTDVTVLLQGETGVGKELAALALVEEGPRRDAPMVVFDCGAISAELIESQIFGYEKGAYTGADRSSEGVFERANGGTLILDAVCDLPYSLQSRLLGALERRAVQRLGGETVIPVDVRVIAMSQTPLEQLVNQNKFRSDLYYRLSSVQLAVPPLREHVEDIPELVAHFLGELGGKTLAPAVLERLYTGNYPGNVRQLRNAVERALLGLEVAFNASNSQASQTVDIQKPLIVQRDALAQAFERRYLEKQLEACSHNISEAARRAGIDRMHMHRLLQRHGLVAPRRKGVAT